MKIYDVTDQEFRQFGSIVKGFDFTELLEVMKAKHIPKDMEYVASDTELEKLPVFEEVMNRFYGGMTTQLGYCMGQNQKLNALEYHKGSELNIAATDYVVLLGRVQDIDENFQYNTEFIKAFYIPEKTAVEFYATTLHYCACHVNVSGYMHATFLPRGTNCELSEVFQAKTEEDTLLRAKNKWMLVHEEGGFEKSLPTKLVGKNIEMSLEDALNVRAQGRTDGRKI